jgi:hypothetical protein
MIPALLRHSLLGLSILAGSSGAGAAESPDAVFDRYVAAVHTGDMATPSARGWRCAVPGTPRTASSASGVSTSFACATV